MFSNDKYVQLAKRILSVVSPVRIFLLGTTYRKYQTESIFTNNILSNDLEDHYHVLVLIRRNLETSCNSVQEKIERVCQTISPVTAFVIEVEQFNAWLSQGHPFACFVTSKSKVLFKDETIDLVDAVPTDNDTQNKFKQEAYTRGLNQVNEFLAGTDLFIVRKQNKMAAFMLHQAAESALLTILKTSIGLSVNSHNLDKLVRYCALVTENVADIFKRNSENEKRLFTLLQRAYIETRYREDYAIKTPDLLDLTDKVKKLQEILIATGRSFCH